MHVKFVLPALTEARSPDWRPIKYALFPPLGLATLAGYLDDGDTAEIQDEHVAPLTLDDRPDLVAIQVYVTSAARAYRIADRYRARGVPVVLDDDLLDRAVACGLRSLFIGFETLSESNLARHHKHQNHRRDYDRAIRRLHDRGVMINGSFIFGLDRDTPDVFPQTVDWAVAHGIETATFHILTPYPGTALHARMAREGRILHRDWDLYDTRHAVFNPRGMSPIELEQGYRWAYRAFYRWRSIVRSARTKDDLRGTLRHLAYTAGWKKFEGFWDLIIRAGQVHRMVPVLEWVLGLSAPQRRTAPVRAPGPSSP